MGQSGFTTNYTRPKYSKLPFQTNLAKNLSPKAILQADFIHLIAWPMISINPITFCRFSGKS